MNYSLPKHAFENRHFRGGGGDVARATRPPEGLRQNQA